MDSKDKKDKPEEAGNSKSLLTALMYGVVSISITLFNKSVLSEWKFNYAKTITLFQTAATLVFLLAIKLSGQTNQFDKLNFAMARRVFPLAMTYMAYVVVSLSSLEGVNVPMFTSLRRLGILFVMALEYYVLHKKPTKQVAQTVVVMILGAVIAGARDVTFDLVAYFWVMVANLSTALYVVYIKRVTTDTGLSSLNLMLYNNLITMPMLAVYCFVSGEFREVANYPFLLNWNFIRVFGASVVLAFLLNYSVFLSSHYNSPTTQTVVGQIKNFFTIVLGMLLFSDYKYDSINLLGLCVGFAGSAAYAYVTFNGPKPAAKTATKATNPQNSAPTPGATTEAPAKGHKSVTPNPKSETELTSVRTEPVVNAPFINTSSYARRN